MSIFRFTYECKECKGLLTEKITTFLTAHQIRREKAKDNIEDYLLSNRY